MARRLALFRVALCVSSCVVCAWDTDVAAEGLGSSRAVRVVTFIRLRTKAHYEKEKHSALNAEDEADFGGCPGKQIDNTTTVNQQ
jgi:hypothetical protein